MKTKEIFAGTCSMSKVARKRNHETFTLDNDKQHNCDITADILNYDPGSSEYIHFSPPCTAFSVASMGKHWTGGFRGYEPKTESARLGLRLLDRTAELIAKNKPKYWTIENPMGMFRKLMPEILKKHGINNFRMVTVTYCQYGDKRMKPTDFITNIPNWQGRRCKNGSSCHESAPRGSKTGTQGLKNAKERGVIPSALFEEIFEHIEALSNN